MLLAETAGRGRLMYDAGQLGLHGFRVTTPSRHAVGLMGKVRDVVEHRSGDRWEEAVRAIGRKADIVLALLEQFAAAPLALRRAKVPPYRNSTIVMLSCWLAERLRIASTDDRRALVRKYGDVDLVLFLSQNQRDIFEEAGFQAERLAMVPFGVDERALQVAPRGTQRDIPVVAVGFDRGRDYATLFEAARGLETPIQVYCRQTNLAAVSIPPSNVEIHQPVPYLEYLDLLRRAQVVVVPTFELAYPTGQSVALEASAAGCCVIATGTAPMREYLESDMTALLFGAGDADELRRHIDRSLADSDLRARLGAAARQKVLDRFTTWNMWAAAAEAIDRRIDGGR